MIAPTYIKADTNITSFPLIQQESSEWHYGNLFSNKSGTDGILFQIQIEGLIAPNWRIVKSFEIIIERDEDSKFVTSDEITTVYGDGNTPFEALQDYFESLVDYYQLIAARAEQDPANQRLLDYLQNYIHHYRM